MILLTKLGVDWIINSKLVNRNSLPKMELINR